MEIFDKKNSFSVKILRYNMIIVATVVGILLSAFMVYYLYDQNTNMNKQLDNVVNGIEIDVKNSIEIMETVVLQLGMNTFVIDTMEDIQAEKLSNYNYFDANLVVAAEVYKYLWTYILEENNITRISIYSDRGDYIYTGEALEENENISYIDIAYIDKIKDGFKHSEDYTLFLNKINGQYKNNRLKSLAVVSQINSKYLSEKTNGYVEVEVSIKRLEKKLQDTFTNGDVFILYNATTDKVIGSSYVDLNENTNESYEDFIEKNSLGQYYKKSAVIDEYSIGIIVLRSKGAQIQFIVKVVCIIIATYFMLFFIIVLIQKKVIEGLAKPLVELCDQVKYAGNDFENRRNMLANGDNEIKVLSNAFSQMLDRLQESMQNAVDAKTGEIKAQLFALQAQMNPHFIHNTIAIIQSYALEDDYEMVTKVCEKLSDMIRYSTVLSEQKIPLKDELNYVKNYMELVKIRYEEGIHFNLYGEEQIDGIFVPRFIIQPFIENSLNHGLKQKEFPWEITLRCLVDNGKWMVYIEDNGIGMSDDTIKSIDNFIDEFKKGNSKITDKNLQIGGLSIKNIATRLYLEYKENMIFNIQSKENKFTIVCIGVLNSKIGGEYHD